MRIHVNGRNIEITEAIKAYVKEKIGKVATHYDQIQGIEVILSVIKNPAAAEKHIAEVRCNLDKVKIHLEESAESMYASIDLLSDKLLRQVQKVKDKALSSNKASIRMENVDNNDEEEIEVVEAMPEE
ncbi:MAG: ribosome-associated translation inhibitor RaiA [Candidatus Melainabacteria bacterium]|jgi:putative sigma-54 modulation protein|nr:MAG: ribosome-associated translation inhibitor RaiA [Candidatus Melainabacteria bacterium]RAI10434.1 MAG: ribosome-associated translation inhibitor RaiA [Candidatus Melainabacteria bacterium]